MLKLVAGPRGTCSNKHIVCERVYGAATEREDAHEFFILRLCSNKM